MTLKASRRLFEEAPTLARLSRLEEEKIAELIYPCGFYRVKSANLKKISRILLDENNGEVPSSLESLLMLPGVGLKTANLVLSPGFCHTSHMRGYPCSQDSQPHGLDRNKETG